MNESGQLSEEAERVGAAFAVGFIPVIPLGFLLEHFYGSVTAGLTAGTTALLIALVWSSFTTENGGNTDQ